MISKKSKIVQASLCDSKLNLSIIGIFNIVEDDITTLMEKLKIDGVRTLEKYNSAWVFVKNRIKIFQDIKWNSLIETHCFISLITPSKIIFDTAIYFDGSLAIYSRAVGCALDMTTKLIRRTNTVGVDESITTENEICNVEFNRLTSNLDEFVVKDKTKIKYTNIDYLNHTNNVEYLRLLLNAFTPEEMDKKQIKEIEINYKNQSFFGEEISILTLEKQQSTLYQIKKEDKVLVEGEIFYI